MDSAVLFPDEVKGTWMIFLKNLEIASTLGSESLGRHVNLW